MSTPTAAHAATAPATQITLRPSTAADETEIVRLATIDSAEVPAGPLLLAEVDGEIHAALTLTDGRVIADPFVRTTALVELLRVHRRMSGPARDRRGLRRLRSQVMRASEPAMPTGRPGDADRR